MEAREENYDKKEEIKGKKVATLTREIVHVVRVCTSNTFCSTTDRINRASNAIPITRV